MPRFKYTNICNRQQIKKMFKILDSQETELLRLKIIVLFIHFNRIPSLLC